MLGQINLALAAREVLRDGGSITLTTGILTEQPIRQGSSASLVNGAVEAFVRAAAIELPRQLRINVVSPNVLVESMSSYGPFFRGFEPVTAARAAVAYSRSVRRARRPDRSTGCFKRALRAYRGILRMKRRGSGDGDAAKPSAYNKALGLLARREHSRRELRQKLDRGGYEGDEATDAIERLGAQHYQDDERFAELLIRSRSAQGYGPLRLRAELKSHGLPDARIRAPARRGRAGLGCIGGGAASSSLSRHEQRPGGAGATGAIPLAPRLCRRHSTICDPRPTWTILPTTALEHVIHGWRASS